MNNPFNNGLKPTGINLPIPQGGIQVGNQIMYPDTQGNLHPTPGQAINSNMNVERDFSRGASGGCSQDPAKVPNQGSGS